ncbi:NLP/P60 family protein [Streptomyces albus]|uniref:NLP/P60 family protein n=1 Tax=Streptomyces albus (strain ATCC 21838 / DSM 41398 / FERM P-419 / JCM 4703 / NBRC 107858) TaxID=1081613 RepID=A0A0B5EW33_STRA4|nr:NLP/P60 family protein [Streptomyces albus]AOU81332.1 NLP/P60 family protein [Streptomyces albus]
MQYGPPEPYPSGPWGQVALPRPGDFASPNPTGHPSQAADEGLRMSALNRVPAVLTRAGTASALTLAAVGGGISLPGTVLDAQALAPATKALEVAASKQGAPYGYGATGPNSFDCSGLTKYAFKHAGKELPRTAQQQFNATKRVPPAQRRNGDLVFFGYRGNVYHVGIYAGHGRIWHSPKTGAVVRLEKIWSSSVQYGRVD